MHHIEIVSQLDAGHLEQLPELLDAATRVDGHEPIGEHKFLRLQRGEDLAAAILAFEDSHLAGYAHTVTYGAEDDRRASCEFVVHPGYRRRGVGRTLLAHAIMHAQAQDARKVDLWAYNDTHASQRIAEQFGFRPVRRLLHLHRHLANMPEPLASPGAVLRSIRPGVDDDALLILNNRIFDGHPENGSWTPDDLRARMQQPWFDADDLLMLEVEGTLAGFCWLKVEERPGEGRVGEVYVIGIAPEFQGRGLSRHLLAHALRRVRDRAADVVAVYVDESNEPAIALYETNGFHYHHVDVCYERELGSDATLVTEAA